MKANHLRILMIGIAAVVLFGLFLPGQASAAPAADPVINHVYVSTVRDGSFVVSWTTDIASNGSVTWGTSKPPATTVTDSVASTTTHFVTISGLTQNSTYYFQVTSGATVDNNGGAYYQVTTGPTLTPPGGSQLIWGNIYQSDGTTLVPNALVYLQIQDANGSGSSGASQWIAVRSNSSGSWSFNLVNLRTADLSAYYIFTPGVDQVRLVGDGGILGTKGSSTAPWTMPVPATFPTQINIVLESAPTAITLSKFAASAPTPTWPLFGAALAGSALLASLWVSRRRQVH